MMLGHEASVMVGMLGPWVTTLKVGQYILMSDS